MPRDRKGQRSKGDRKRKEHGDDRSARAYDADDVDDLDSAVSNDYDEEARSHFTDDDRDQDSDGAEVIDDVRSRIDEHLSQLEQKSSKMREAGVNQLCHLFSKSYLPDELDNIQETLFLAVVNLVRRGGAAEKCMACDLAGILIIQLGLSDSTERYMEELTPLLSTLLRDNSKSKKLRAACARVMTLGSFVTGELPDHMEVIEKLRATLDSCSAAKPGPDSDELIGSMLTCWSLLLTRMPAQVVMSQGNSLVSTFATYLESGSTAVRQAAGKAITNVYELARIADEKFCSEAHEKVAAHFSELATDHSRRRSKNEKKATRAEFRPMLAFLEDGETPDESILLCKQQALHLTSWSELTIYDFLKSVLRGGIHEHLRENEFVRDVFGLGASLGAQGDVQVLSSNERKMAYAARRVHRQLDRGARRDKRTAMF